MRENEDGFVKEDGKLMGIREKIRKGIKENYNVNAIYFAKQKRGWKEIWVTESVSREDE